jgi:hypothetical protein
MHFEGQNLESDFTVGETMAVLAPLFNTSIEKMKGYVCVYMGQEDDGAMSIGIISNDQHPGCRINMLAQVIALIAHDMDESDDA